MRSLEAFAEAFKKLLPSGIAWNWKGDIHSSFHKLIKGLASEFWQVDADADAISYDMLPQNTAVMLEDWEYIAGLPGPCADLASTTSGRRNQLLAKLRMQGGATKKYMIARAADAGYDIDIQEYRAFNCEENCEEPLSADEDWEFVFYVMGQEYPLTNMTCIDACTSPLREWGVDRLQCLILTIRPAHLWPVFQYTA